MKKLEHSITRKSIFNSSPSTPSTPTTDVWDHSLEHGKVCLPQREFIETQSAIDFTEISFVSYFAQRISLAVLTDVLFGE